MIIEDIIEFILRLFNRNKHESISEIELNSDILQDTENNDNYIAEEIIEQLEENGNKQDLNEMREGAQNEDAGSNDIGEENENGTGSTNEVGEGNESGTGSTNGLGEESEIGSSNTNEVEEGNESGTGNSNEVGEEKQSGNASSNEIEEESQSGNASSNEVGEENQSRNIGSNEMEEGTQSGSTGSNEMEEGTQSGNTGSNEMEEGSESGSAGSSEKGEGSGSSSSNEVEEESESGSSSEKGEGSGSSSSNEVGEENQSGSSNEVGEESQSGTTSSNEIGENQSGNTGSNEVGEESESGSSSSNEIEKESQGGSTSSEEIEETQNSEEIEENNERARERSNQLFGNIPKMEEMQSGGKGGEYSLGYGDLDLGEIPDSVISMLIEKFLNERFLKKDNDLNRRTNSSKITEGYYDWDLNALIRDKVTKNYNQMLRDKHGYKYSDGNDEKIPFSFYFDLSGSMTEYSRLLSIIAVKLIKKDVKIITGFNETAQIQIDKVPAKFDADDFKSLLSGNMSEYDLRRKNIEFTTINQDIDDYLISKGAEKAVVFSDFDPDRNVVNLAKNCDVYWFSFERRYRDLTCGSSLRDFKGRYYRTYDIKDFATHMKRITSRYYERQQRESQLDR